VIREFRYIKIWQNVVRNTAFGAMLRRSLRRNPLQEESMGECGQGNKLACSQSVSDDVITATSVQLINRRTCLIEHHYTASTSSL